MECILVVHNLGFLSCLSAPGELVVYKVDECTSLERESVSAFINISVTCVMCTIGWYSWIDKLLSAGLG